MSIFYQSQKMPTGNLKITLGSEQWIVESVHVEEIGIRMILSYPEGKKLDGVPFRFPDGIGELSNSEWRITHVNTITHLNHRCVESLATAL
jgi:hypothetical protein